MIQSIAYFLITEDSNPLSRFSRLGRLRWHPYGDDIASQRSNELFAGFTEELKHNFFRLQGKRRSQMSIGRMIPHRLFVEFISLIYLSFIKKKMSEKNLSKQFTIQGLIDEVDLIECFNEPGKSLTVGEIL